MIRMGLGASLVLPINIKAEIFPALVAELEKVLVQGHTTNFTAMDLHFRLLKV
jgi:hypothetical protein